MMGYPITVYPILIESGGEGEGEGEEWKGGVEGKMLREKEKMGKEKENKKR